MDENKGCTIIISVFFICVTIIAVVLVIYD